MSAPASSTDTHICPVLAGPALIKGTKLQFRSINEELNIAAPASYLSKLYDWCNGERTLAALEELSVSQWGNTGFIDFVRALMDAGVLVDASSYLRYCAESADYPSWMGRPAQAMQWRQGIQSLPPTLPLLDGLLSLPNPRPQSLTSISAARMSVTRFDATPFSVQLLADLLHAAYGIQRHPNNGEPHRTVPSAGGFYGLQLHVVLLRPAEKLTTGVYRASFAANGGVALLKTSQDVSDALRAVVHPHLLTHAAGLLMISGDVGAAELKYRNRAYRYALLEAGCVLQNLGLASAELGVGWRVIGGYDDVRMRTLAQIHDNQDLLAMGVFGLPEIANPAPARADLEFHWSDDFPETGQHIGRARLAGQEDHPYSWGKDCDPASAYNKAVGEAIERHAYSGFMARYALHAPFTEAQDALDPRALVAYSRTQYRNPDFPFRQFDPQARLPWVSASEVISGKHVLLLADCVFDLGQDTDAVQRGLYTHANSSGCASGVSLSQATDNAVLELIERDAFMRHWFAQDSGLAIERASLPGTVMRRLANLEKAGCHTSVQCLNRGIYPVFLVMIQHQKLHFTAVGASTGFSDTALDSALSEAEILALARLRGAPRNILTPASVRLASDHADLYGQRAYYRRADRLIATGAETRYALVNHQLAGGHAQLWDRLDALNQRAICVDLTMPNAPQTLAQQDIYTVRAFVPGLIPLNFGYGRLPLGMPPQHRPQARFPHPFS